MMSRPGETHVSVLGPEVCDALAPALGDDATPRGVYVDATTGLGGHTAAILQATRPAACVLVDRDTKALALAKTRLADAPCPIHFVHAPFATLTAALAELGLTEVDAILADLGVSSMQLDDASRGFSFRADAPLDMRMDPSTGPTAAEAIAGLDADGLARILREYGDEPDARRIARAIVDEQPTTTSQLAAIVADAMSARQRRQLGTRIHPATRTFMALRIHVNGELEQIDRFLADAPQLLVVGGRLAVISFHSLEDRRVKRAFRRLASPPEIPADLPVRAEDMPKPAFAIPQGYRRGVVPGQTEIATNPRARSARLRVIERCLP